MQCENPLRNGENDSHLPDVGKICNRRTVRSGRHLGLRRFSDQPRRHARPHLLEPTIAPTHAPDVHRPGEL
jgi:hypothetical protein